MSDTKSGINNQAADSDSNVTIGGNGYFSEVKEIGGHVVDTAIAVASHNPLSAITNGLITAVELVSAISDEITTRENHDAIEKMVDAESDDQLDTDLDRLRKI